VLHSSSTVGLKSDLNFFGWPDFVLPFIVDAITNRRPTGNAEHPGQLGAPQYRTAPVTTMKTAWEAVRRAAKVDCRLHDLRHSFCTKLARRVCRRARCLI
jgi:integrase